MPTSVSFRAFHPWTTSLAVRRVVPQATPMSTATEPPRPVRPAPPLAADGPRLVPAALLSGLVAGAVAGLGSRLAMFVIRLMNDSHTVVAWAGRVVLGAVGARALVADVVALRDVYHLFA